MKLFSLFFVFASLLVANYAATAADSDMSPFDSVIVRDGTIVATLPVNPHWNVRVGSAESRLSKPGESFTLQAGESLRLDEKHLHYQVTAQLVPKPGLRMVSTFDARSFGNGIKAKSYFITAKQAM